MNLLKTLFRWCGVGCAGIALVCAGADRELIRDPHFQNGFYLLKPEQGKRVPYGQLPGLNPAKPIWDLAQWSSRVPLALNNCFSANQSIIYSNAAKTVVVGAAGSPAADLSLAVNAASEYPQARKSNAEPWVHLLVQQDFENPPALGDLSACNFHVEARLKRSRLVSTNDYSPSVHAAQYFIYFSVANRNPKASGYGECFWFGIPVYDNRYRIVPTYEAQDFGQTKLFIFTPGTETFARQSTAEGQWVTFEKDLLPLMRQGLEHARAKGFIKGSQNPADYHPLGIFIGWEVPGIFDVDLQIRGLSLKAVAKP